MRRGRFFLGRVVKSGMLDQPKFIEALTSPVIITANKYSWTITDCTTGRIGESEYIYGNLAKFRDEGHVVIVDVDKRSQRDAIAPNLLEATAPFVYLPAFSGISYMHVWNGIQEDVFRRRIKAIVEKKYDNFFVDCTIEAVSDYRAFSKKLSTLDRFTEISATVNPPNPLFGNIWKDLKDYIVERNTDDVKIEETERNSQGIRTKIREIIDSILFDSNYTPEKPAAIGDAAILMAADGYGKGKVIGFHQGSEIVIRTSDTQKSFLLRKSPSPEELAQIAHDHFKRISDERKMEHP